MKEVKTKKEKQRGRFLLKISLFFLAAFLVLVLIGQQIQISSKTDELAGLQQEINTQTTNNEELKSILDDSERMKDYAEDTARKEYGYAKPEEKIFVNIGGTE